jgi:hypothetical protein
MKCYFAGFGGAFDFADDDDFGGQVFDLGPIQLLDAEFQV